jgi:2-methylisocitrate lyase-like PEP mutase family enzyme
VEDAAATARGAIEAGAAGLNFEDWDLDTNALCAIDLQSTRIKAIRETGESLGFPLVINARTDVYLQNLGDSDSWRFEETVRRANAYLRAGADCAFVPGVTDETLIARLVQAIRGPVSVLAFASSPPVPALAKAGVARISVGGSPMGIALAAFKQFALEVSQRGDFSTISQRIPANELNALFD